MPKKKPETFEGKASSALESTASLYGALQVVCSLLDQIEAVRDIAKEHEDPKAAIAKGWHLIVEKVREARIALGQLNEK